MADLELRAQRRAVQGKKVRFLRRQGFVPANLYGAGVTSTALQFPARELETVLRRTGPTSLLPLTFEGGTPRRVLVREVQRHPVNDQVLHLDLYAVAMDERMRATVPLHFVGEAPAVTELDGTLLHNLEGLDVECLPGDLPPRIEVDLSGLRDLHASLHVADLALPAAVTVLTAPDTVVATVVPPTVEEPEPEAPAEAVPATEPTASEGEATS